MSLSVEMRRRFAEENVLAAFKSRDTASLLLGVPADELDEVVDSARDGSLRLEDLGLAREDLDAALGKRHPTPGDTPEVDGIKTAYMLIATSRDLVVSAISAPRPSP